MGWRLWLAHRDIPEFVQRGIFARKGAREYVASADPRLEWNVPGPASFQRRTGRYGRQNLRIFVFNRIGIARSLNK